METFKKLKIVLKYSNLSKWAQLHSITDLQEEISTNEHQFSFSEELLKCCQMSIVNVCNIGIKYII